MHIEIASVGDEILKGRTINTNAAFLAQHLHRNGYPVSAQVTLSDERVSLLAGLKAALARSDLVIATGGLGPTLDDGTREVAAEIFGSDFYCNEQIAEELKRRYADRYSAVADQSRIPRKAQVLPNQVGSAVGLIFSEGGKRLILLPGVPREMEPMFLDSVLPFLAQHYAGVRKETHLLFFCLLYESLLDPHLRALSDRYPSVEAGIYPAFGTVTVSLSGSASQELACFKQALVEQFGDYLYQAPTGKVEEALYLCLTQRKLTLACAESCTGGRIASALTAVAGASDYFLGSLVTYSNALKEHLLGVSQATLAQWGAVSEETVKQMLEGVFRQTAADYGIAVSGIAGPTGGTVLKPVGTVYAAVGRRGELPDVGVFHVSGNRDKIAAVAAHCLIGALWRKVEKGIPVFPFLVASAKNL